MEPDQKKTKKLFSLLGVILHSYGVNAHQLEETLNTIALKLDIKFAQFFSSPTMILMKLQNKTEDVILLERVEPGIIDLSKLSECNEVVNDILYDRQSVDQAIITLEEILKTENQYHKALRIFMFGITSFGVALFMKASWYDCLASFSLASLLGIFESIFNKNLHFKRIYEVLVTFIITLLSGIIVHFFIHLKMNHTIISLASIVYLLPGLSITVAVAELATNNLVSGSARLIGGLASLLKIVFGYILATKALKYLGIDIAFFNSNYEYQYFVYPVLILTSLGLAILFKTRPKDLIHVIFFCSFVFISLKITGHFFGHQSGVFLTSILLGLLSNLYGKLVNIPILTIQMPSIIFMVPGSIGYRALSMLYEYKIDLGIGSMMEMSILALSIVGGLFYWKYDYHT